MRCDVDQHIIQLSTVATCGPAIKKWPLKGGGLFMEVKMNGENRIGAAKVAFLKGGNYRQVLLREGGRGEQGVVGLELGAPSF